MVVLDCYGKVEPICISHKLKLYVSNLPKSQNNDWCSELVAELNEMEAINKLQQKRLQLHEKSCLKELYEKTVGTDSIPELLGEKEIRAIVDNMICLYFEYEYSDMPLGGWDTNCFDGRFCEEDYAEKNIDLMMFLSNDTEGTSFPEPIPQWIYSSNHDEINSYRIFWGGDEAKPYIESLIKWGKLFDEMLKSNEDYLLFDYLCNAIHEDNEYNTYHFLKSFSLCQLFLEKDKEKELDEKLPQFLDPRFEEDERREKAKQLRQIRNKIAHGDYKQFTERIEEYAKTFMDGRFWFDYSEYSRQNWVLLNICCELDNAIRKMLYMLFTERKELDRIKGCKA